MAPLTTIQLAGRVDTKFPGRRSSGLILEIKNSEANTELFDLADMCHVCIAQVKAAQCYKD